MCRWLAYTGHPILVSDLVVDSNNSLVNQTLSFEGYQPLEHVPRYPVDGDGFGLGWYDRQISHEPARLVFTDPAWNNPNLDNLAHLLRTQLVFAHVRAASRNSSVSRSNCHPFKYGHLLFMHNGGVAGFRPMRRRFLEALPDRIFESVQGTTDSEHCFALFLSLLPTLKPPIPTQVLKETMAATIETVLTWSHEMGITDKTTLNFAVTDGFSVVATRFASWYHPEQQIAQSLYVSQAKGFEIGEDGNLHHRRCPDRTVGAVIIASEPLTANMDHPDCCPEWEPVPEDSLIAVDPTLNVTIESLDVKAPRPLARLDAYKTMV